MSENTSPRIVFTPTQLSKTTKPQWYNLSFAITKFFNQMASQSKTTMFKEEGQLPLIHWQPRGRAINMASMKLQTNKDKLTRNHLCH